ncbi:phosphoserine phosphatase SerB [Rhodospirillum rubrum]|uniref:phosphoserine phosphatase SerB n=1 Tax=Rhodospirillum rubrum TaxID=1085 RepID=UPI001903B6F5|nr:phosphoserine phosphatase SerB [Rhodospirillum rubrum]MBK1663373.1 phosphoserine phosphatase SerB [Rhodospirillum rubrum]MBK1675545.1 phosphoserine phosphatase SerB [Rhodospirillum rubrum]
MDVVVTVLSSPAVGGLDEEALAAARAALDTLGGETARPRWLESGVAADIRVDALSVGQAGSAVRHALADVACDVVAQREDGRRKGLLIADMDSTMVIGETLDDLAAHAGLKDKIAAITARAMNGEIDFEAALRERVGMLAGLSASALEETWAATALTPGGRTLVRTMAANGARCVLVSGGFSVFTAKVAKACGFHDHLANRLEIIDGALSGKVIDPVVDRAVKLATLKAEAAKLGLPLSACAAVGDGANDLPMVMAAGLGVAFHAKPLVAAQTRARIDHGDLTALLFLQGYRREEFIED